MATTIRMQVLSQEVWGTEGQTFEAIRLGPEGSHAQDVGYYGPESSVSLFFPKGQGFSAFPMGGLVDVTFTPQEARE